MDFFLEVILLINVDMEVFEGLGVYDYGLKEVVVVLYGNDGYK